MSKEFVRNGVYYSNEDRSGGIDKEIKKDIFDIVMRELSPDNPFNMMRITKIKDVPCSERYDIYSIGIDLDDNITVVQDSIEKFNFAKKVCEAYKVSYKEPQPYGKKFIMRIRAI